MIEMAVEKSLFMVRQNPKLIGNQIFLERDIIDGITVTKGYHLQFLLGYILGRIQSVGEFPLYFRAIKAG